MEKEASKSTRVKKAAVKAESMPTKDTVKVAKKVEKTVNSRTAILEINKMQYVIKEGETITCRVTTDSEAVREVKLLGIVDGEKLSYGTPYLSNKLTFSFGDVVKGDKVVTAKFKAKSRYRRRVASRPQFVKFTLNSINS